MDLEDKIQKKREVDQKKERLFVNEVRPNSIQSLKCTARIPAHLSRCYTTLVLIQPHKHKQSQNP
jgi:hypothetical protein